MCRSSLGQPNRGRRLAETGTGKMWEPDLARLIAVGPAMRRVLQQARAAATLDTPVLLVGEPGTGKRSLAQAIHRASARGRAAFVTVDAARLPPTALLDLFHDAHPHGFATWAREQSAADAALGAIYIREPTHIPRDVQMLVCARADDWRDVRWFLGSTQELEPAVAAGALRPEFYYRFSVLTIRLPPLRERHEEMPHIVEEVIEEISQGRGRSQLPRAGELYRALVNDPWPGNWHELYRVLEQALARAHGAELSWDHFPWVWRSRHQGQKSPAPEILRPLPLDELLQEAEKRIIQLALRQARGNRTRAAQRLRISRARLLRRMEALGLDQSLLEAEGGPGSERPSRQASDAGSGASP